MEMLPTLNSALAASTKTALQLIPNVALCITLISFVEKLGYAIPNIFPSV